MTRKRTQVRTIRPIKGLYLTVSSTTRHHGGHEEGGWWYNITEIGEIFTVHSVLEAINKARELKRENPTCPYGSGSAIGGADVEVCISNQESLLEELAFNGYHPYE